jgi:hypothetical protein
MTTRLTRTTHAHSTMPGSIIGYGKRGPIRLIAGAAEGDPPADPPVSFDQDAVNRIAAREKAQGKAAAVAEIATQLGMSVEDAKKVLEGHKAAEDAAKTEAQRQVDAAKAETNAAKDERAQVVAERHTLNVERALLLAGLPAGDDDAAAKLLGRAAKLVDVEPGADRAAIAAAVTTLKTELPALFTATAAPGGTPPPAPPKGKNVTNGEFGSGGLAKLKERYPERFKDQAS